jgi:hypothetical protein
MLQRMGVLDLEESGRGKETVLFRVVAVVVVNLEESVERGDPVERFGFKVPLDTLEAYLWLAVIVAWDLMAPPK